MFNLFFLGIALLWYLSTISEIYAFDVLESYF